MPAVGETGALPVVFISYAHESDALRAAVKVLAEWLSGRGCTVLIDHAHRYRPPEEGWQAWMLGCIDKADTVLVVCTPKLRARYEKNAPPDTGRGATYEGAIVTQHIYDRAMRNTKFFPILPDGGNVEDIPLTLRPWSNGHWFPSGNRGILHLVCGEIAEVTPPDELGSGEPQWQARNGQEDEAAKLLAEPAAAQFLEAVCSDRLISDKLDTRLGGAAKEKAQRVARLFSQAPCNEPAVRALFGVVHRGLSNVPADDRADAWRAAKKAATALYFLAAARLINLAKHPEDGDDPGSLDPLIPLPSPEDPDMERPRYERIIAAIIANALFGGKLEFESSDDLDLPVPTFVFHVQMAGAHDQPEVNFERAAYTAVCLRGAKGETAASQRDGPLTEPERAHLKTFLRNRRDYDGETVALVLRGANLSDPLRAVVKKCFRGTVVPVLVPDTAATSDLLGMSVSDLEAEIRDFWAKIRQRESENARSSQPRLQGASDMTSKDSGPHFHGPVSITGVSTFGSQSPASRDYANVIYIQQQGIDQENLNQLLSTLFTEIGNINSEDDRDRLHADAEALKDRIVEAKGPDSGALKKVFDRMERVAKPLENGSKIVTALTSLYKLVAAPLGLPALP